MSAAVGARRPLPEYVEQEFEAYLKCGRLEEGFLRVRCEHCHAEKLVAFSCQKRGFCPSCGAPIDTDFVRQHCPGTVEAFERIAGSLS